MNVPQNEYAEDNFLGLLIRGEISPSQAAEKGITEAHFIARQGLFTAISEFIESGGESHSDFIMQLHAQGTLDQLGTAALIMNLHDQQGEIHSLTSYVNHLRTTYGKRLVMQAAHKLTLDPNDPESHDQIARGLMEQSLAQVTGKLKRQPLVAGVNGFPTDPPPHTILVGNGAIRIGDIAMLNSGAGMGKSVSVGQMAMAWALGLPYFGIKPARPLRILHYVGEDDEATMGQIREGFLLHSLAITGRQLTAKDLESLDEMLQTQFDISAIGDDFICEVEKEIEEFKPDMVFINPLLSYIGGDPVALATHFLRVGLMPILKKHNCAALIAHHTCKLNKDSWNTMDPTYSGIGGSEMANIPRIVLTIMPTSNGMIRLQAAKRTTVGWKDEQGKYKDYAYFRRTDDPTRPAWLPVSYEEGESRPAQSEGNAKGKCTTGQIIAILEKGDTLKVAMVDHLMKLPCSISTAERAIKHALGMEDIFEYEDKEKPVKGGSRRKWLTLTPQQDEPEAGGQTNEPLT